MARPSDKTPEVTARICSLLLEGVSVTAMCKLHDDLPEAGTVFRWLSEDSQFRDDYARAKIAGCEALADALLEISDDGTNDYVDAVDKKGKAIRQFDGEHVQRSRLRVDTRKWYLSKLVPKIWGEKISHEHSGPEGGPIKFDDSTAAARIEAIFAAAALRKAEEDFGDLV